MVDERIPLSKTLIDLRIKELELEEKARVISELKAKRDEASIRELVSKIADDSWHLRELAVRALSDLGREVEEAVIEGIAGSLWYTRACAAEILGRVRSRVALGRLIELLDDPNATVREKAAKALLEICDAGDTVWTARAAAAKGEEAVRKLAALFEKSDRELAGAFLSMARDIDLMKAPAEQVERIAEEMSRASGAEDLVWEELTGEGKGTSGRKNVTGVKESPGKKEGGGEAGEHGSL
ncbi:MAG: HEAT repeat domain-containing protein [Candidatus Eisenbacteria bacterium]